MPFLRMPRLLFGPEASLRPWCAWHAELLSLLGHSSMLDLRAAWRLAGGAPSDSFHLVMLATDTGLMLVNLGRSTMAPRSTHSASRWRAHSNSLENLDFSALQKAQKASEIAEYMQRTSDCIRPRALSLIGRSLGHGAMGQREGRESGWLDGRLPGVARKITTNKYLWLKHSQPNTFRIVTTMPEDRHEHNTPAVLAYLVRCESFNDPPTFMPPASGTSGPATSYSMAEHSLVEPSPRRLANRHTDQPLDKYCRNLPGNIAPPAWACATSASLAKDTCSLSMRLWKERLRKRQQKGRDSAELLLSRAGVLRRASEHSAERACVLKVKFRSVNYGTDRALQLFLRQRILNGSIASEDCQHMLVPDGPDVSGTLWEHKRPAGTELPGPPRSVTFELKHRHALQRAHRQVFLSPSMADGKGAFSTSAAAS
ncbi:unnamed protein product [Prorocentrum cordatum]|uniref:Uncharacterized protein n=1 Tax=Prorocentrum cordatum TaxID=2364126 RepID=A0ABN9XGG0_9DINO|nr:unnamed protein product [Polarella glacialis]